METEINLGDKYNYEKDISMTIELDKTCYSKGELIHGIITLIQKGPLTLKRHLKSLTIPRCMRTVTVSLLSKRSVVSHIQSLNITVNKDFLKITALKSVVFYCTSHIKIG